MPDTNLPAPAPSNTMETRAKTTKPASSVPEASKTNPGHSVHFVLQGKGGVGKSLIASYLAQYLSDEGRLEACFDTDPVNGSLQSVPALKAQPVKLLIENKINVKGVDRLMETIVSSTGDVVVDNGAASFLPLSSYLIEGDIMPFLMEHGTNVVIHTVVTGGPNGLDTLKGLEALVDHFTPEATVVVWINEFFGPVRFDGTDFEDTSVYQDCKGKIRGLVHLRKPHTDLFAPVLADMLERHLTFAEASTSSEYVLLEKSRLFRLKKEVWDQLAIVL